MDLIKIGSTAFNGISVRTVNARDLHEFLEIGKDFSNWIKLRIEQFGFVEGHDYLLAKTGEQVPHQGGWRSIVRIDYHLTLDMAKELSMVERNARGKQARQYFIDCERRAKAATTVDPMRALSDPATLRNLLLNYSEQVQTLRVENASMRQDVKALNTISKSEGSLCLTNAAKALQIGQKQLINWLRVNSWIYRRYGGRLAAYQHKIRSGDLEHKVSTISRQDGSEKLCEDVRVTPQGLTKLAKIFAPDEDQFL